MAMILYMNTIGYIALLLRKFKGHLGLSKDFLTDTMLELYLELNPPFSLDCTLGSICNPALERVIHRLLNLFWIVCVIFPVLSCFPKAGTCQ